MASPPAVDDLVTALGIDSGISKSEVSRICAGLDETVAAFRSRPLRHTTFPYLFLDATYLHVRRTGAGGQVTSRAVVIATGVTATGNREVLGVDVGDSEDEVFWRGFLRSLKEHGLQGTQLVISDQHSGLVAALRRVLQGASHQRCRVHFARNLLALVPKSHKGHGRRRIPHDLRPTRRRHRRRHLGQRPRPAGRPVPKDRATDG
jgi:putative transposase